MAIHDHYLLEDFNQVSTHLDIMHQATMNILKAGTNADFQLGKDSKIQLEKSYQVLEALHKKKIHREESHHVEYMRRNYF